MKADILYNKVLAVDSLPKESLVNNSAIKSHILLNYIKNNSDNNHIPLSHQQDCHWVFQYIHEKFNVKLKEVLGIKNMYAEVHNINEMTVKKNNHDHYDLTNSPYYTAAYIVQGENSNLIIEWENALKKNQTKIVPIKQNTIIIWNSDLNYYFTSNNFDEERIVLFFNLYKAELI
jgi:hypothetical protein